MKKLLLVCAIVVGLSAMSHAQGRVQRTPEEQAAQLKTSLALNDDQTAKITAIYKAQAASRDSLMKAGGHMIPAIGHTTQVTNEKIKNVLTADQAAAYDKQIARIMDQRRAAMADIPTPPRK